MIANNSATEQIPTARDGESGDSTSVVSADWIRIRVLTAGPRPFFLVFDGLFLNFNAILSISHSRLSRFQFELSKCVRTSPRTINCLPFQMRCDIVEIITNSTLSATPDPK
jgi:hypothetical protein